MAASTTLATRTALKLYLGIDASDAAQDDLLDALNAYASERIESHCRRAFASDTVTDYLDGTRTSRLVLSRRPVTALTSIHEDSDRAFAADTEIDSADLVLHPEQGIVDRLGAVFAPGARTVKVVYTAGYASISQYAIYGFIFYTLAMGMLIGSLFGVQVGAMVTKVVEGTTIRGFYAMAVLAGFINRIFALPGKLSDLEVISLSPAVVQILDGIGIWAFFLVIGGFAMWVFYVFFSNLGRLRGVEVSS